MSDVAAAESYTLPERTLMRLHGLYWQAVSASEAEQHASQRAQDASERYLTLLAVVCDNAGIDATPDQIQINWTDGTISVTAPSTLPATTEPSAAEEEQTSDA